jgi:hypothetical protein
MILYSTNTDELIQRLIIENSDYGRKPDVQLVSGTSFIDNEKDYIDYLNYFILKGLKEIDYYMDVLPHETMHLIGIGGGVIGEGIAERRTRQICKKYNLQCAPILHTKEAKLVGLMERLAGDPVITRAGFASGKERYKELEQSLDNKCSKGFFEQIISDPIIQYQRYLKCRCDNPIRTFNAYRQMDFSNSYRLLEHQIEWDR